MSPGIRRAVLRRDDGDALERAAREDGVASLREAADALVDSGVTTQQEVDRVLGTA